MARERVPPPPLGIAVYRSNDGGRTWSAPDFIHRSTGDDKQWATSDRSPVFSVRAGRALRPARDSG